jgi:sporulation protein YlmC with PRC-barrel domain
MEWCINTLVRRFMYINHQRKIHMNYETADTGIMQTAEIVQGPGPAFMSASTLIGDGVYNLQSENLGDVKDIMLDMRTGKVAYAVLSFGGFLGMGEKLFAVPWAALKLDTENQRFALDIDKDRLEKAPGFDKDSWPDMADPAWENGIHSYYSTTPSAY